MAKLRSNKDSRLRDGCFRPPGAQGSAALLVHATFIAAGLLTGGCGGSSAAPVEVEPAAAEMAPAGVQPPLAPIILTEEEAAGEAARIRREVPVRVKEGFELGLWASERLVSDPVALDVDFEGRVLVTQTARRRGQGEVDIRNIPAWAIPSITLETVEERRAFFREQLSPERSRQNRWLADLNRDGFRDWRDLTVMKERVVQIEDTSGDGRADRAQVFFEGFNDEVTDVAGGVLRHGESVYVAVAPDLWRLRDTTGDGWADSVESLAHGFGVHFGFAGHGMSGVTPGPDGRIYWAIGDNGANVVTPDGRRFSFPHTGVVARADPDGSDFEIFASGLRNTHELAFDDYGNLISVDNDGDHAGEHERIVYLIYGSDSGWRINWQFGKYDDPDNNSYKVWMEEELFKPRFQKRAAYILPPVAAFELGPSGIACNPGTALSDDWRNFVFVSRFTGSPSRSHVSAFRLEPQGAGMKLVEQHDVLTGLQITSLAFGPEGALYLADWTDGWQTNGKGRIWKMDVAGSGDSAIRAETRMLLRESFEDGSSEDLGRLLRHDDRRVRQKAQFELVARAGAGAEVLWAVADRSDHLLARLHAIWGLGQLMRQGGDRTGAVAELLEDDDPEIRAQAARVLGDVRDAAAGGRVAALLQDEEARVRLAAAEALGRMAFEPGVEAIAQMLVRNDDEDAYLRHAGAIALAGIGRAEPLVAFASHESRALRLAAVVALRRMRDPGVAAFLADQDELVVTEAARAINDDRSIPAALPALARILDGNGLEGEALVRRAINANLRLGGATEAQRVARYAARPEAPVSMRVEALEALGVWARPSVLDRVDGSHRGAQERDPALAREAISSVIEVLLEEELPAAVRVQALKTAAKSGLSSVAPAFLALLQGDLSAEVRVAALQGLARLESPLLAEAVVAALADADEKVRGEALRLAPALPGAGPALVETLDQVVRHGPLRERQAALAALGDIRVPEARAVLDQYLEELAAGEFPAEAQLELSEAVEVFGDGALRRRLDRLRRAKAQKDPLSAYGEALRGGDVALGRQLFREEPRASCTQCHSIGSRTGSAGPDLAGVGSRLSREMLLEALVDPSARIAPGYGIVSVVLENGERLTGILLEGGPDRVRLEVSGEEREFSSVDIAERQDFPSSMPSMAPLLTHRQIRDLVAFLTSLREGGEVSKK